MMPTAPIEIRRVRESIPKNPVEAGITVTIIELKTKFAEKSETNKV